MKKAIFGKALALIATGAMLFTAAGCTDGNDTNSPETPSTYKQVNAEGSNPGTVTAVWNFSDTTAYPAGVIADGTALKASSGTGATLTAYGSDIKFDVQNELGCVAVGYSSSTGLTALNKGGKGSLVLELTAQANIIVKATGSGAAAPGRSMGIVKGTSVLSDDLIVSKGSLASKSGAIDKDKDTTWLQIEGADKGTYTIHTNGLRIFEITLNEKVNPVAEVTEVVVSTESDDTKIAAANILTVDSPKKITLNGDGTAVYVFDKGTKEEEDGTEKTVYVDYTPNAVWKSFDENIVTVGTNKSGETVLQGHAVTNDPVTVRARIGTKYTDFNVTVAAGTADKLSPAKKEFVVDTAFSQDYTLTITTAKFSDDAISTFVKGFDVTDFVQAESDAAFASGGELKAVVKSIAADELVITVTGKPAASATGNFTFTVPAESDGLKLLVLDNDGTSGANITKTSAYTFTSDKSLVLFDFESSTDTYTDAASGTATDLAEISGVSIQFCPSNNDLAPTANAIKLATTSSVTGPLLEGSSDDKGPYTYVAAKNDPQKTQALVAFTLTAKKDITISAISAVFNDSKYDSAIGRIFVDGEQKSTDGTAAKKQEISAEGLSISVKKDASVLIMVKDVLNGTKAVKSKKASDFKITWGAIKVNIAEASAE